MKSDNKKISTSIFIAILIVALSILVAGTTTLTITGDNLTISGGNTTITNNYYNETFDGNISALNVSGWIMLGDKNISSWDEINESSSGGGGSSLWTNSSGNATYTAGNVGIGTLSPSSKLEVDGDVSILGSNDFIMGELGTTAGKIILHNGDSMGSNEQYIENSGGDFSFGDESTGTSAILTTASYNFKLGYDSSSLSPSSLVHVSGGLNPEVRIESTYSALPQPKLRFYNNSNVLADIYASRSGGIDALYIEESDIVRVEGDLIGTSCSYAKEAVFNTERGSITSNQPLAMGNGQTPTGAPQVCAGTVKTLAAMCSGAASSSNYVAFELRINGVSQNCDTANVKSLNTMYQAPSSSCDVSFSAGDILNCYTKTETGSVTECVCTFWVQYD